MSNILPFGTSTDSATTKLQPIRLFGCTVIDFNVSADWSSQGGSLSCRLIEDEANGDRLVIPVLGSPILFELKNDKGVVIFQYIGLVDSFSRNASNSKTYSATLSSPMRILDSTQVILDGYTGLGSSIEGTYNIDSLQGMDFGHNNSLIDTTPQPGNYHWWNVSNLINVFGILENDDMQYRVPQFFDQKQNWWEGVAERYGGFGFSGRNQDGIPLVKLMWALHVGINHLPPITKNQKQQTHGGNLLFGRHNYNINASFSEATPFYYHFDAIGFYNQIYKILGPEYRVAGQYQSLKELISSICDEANLEFYSFIDIYTDPTIGSLTLQENDPYIGKPAIMNWIMGFGSSLLDARKFPYGGNYGGTIRIQTINKNVFFNPQRPFSNIAYNLIGLEVPDIKEHLWTQSDSGIHPGKRPINERRHGVDNDVIPYSDPLDSSGIKDRFAIGGQDQGFTEVGTQSIGNGGIFPAHSGDLMVGNSSGIFDNNKLSDLKIKNSDISLKLNDVTTMKVITGGYQSRMVHVPGNMLRHYWGDILVANAQDPRQLDTPTDALEINEQSTKKIPVVTPILDPRDVDDYILIDMKSAFGQYGCVGVMQDGIYAASMLEVRCAMRSLESWKAFFETYKYKKLRNLVNCFYPNCISPTGANFTKEQLEKSTELINDCGGAGYVGASNYLGLGNMFSLSHNSKVDAFITGKTSDNELGVIPSGSGSGVFLGLGSGILCAHALLNVKKYVLPAIFEKVKEIGDTHYGKSWYAPVPYSQTIQDLDGNNIVGDFKRSWELSDSAYTEPSLYYSREIPQSNQFISDGKINAFVNYDHNFIIEGGPYDTNYAEDIIGLVGQPRKIFNFSEYDLNELCITKYENINVIHGSPKGISESYTFLPFGYDAVYNRGLLPFSDIVTGRLKRLVDTTKSGIAPSREGQPKQEVDGKATGPETNRANFEDQYDFLALTSGIFGNVLKFAIEYYYDPLGTVFNADVINSVTSGIMWLSGAAARFVCPDAEGVLPTGFFNYDIQNGIPGYTQPAWLQNIVPALQSFTYEDNGRFSVPFIKFETSRVFLPVLAPGKKGKGFTELPSIDGYLYHTASARRRNLGETDPRDVCASGEERPRKQFAMTDDHLVNVLHPFQPCVCPRSFSYPQISTRYVYGPWMTNLNKIIFRGKIEYEQDESLVPENFLIPTNFGQFGDYTLQQTSGFAGMNLAAQGRANAIDNFGLFAVEEGSITIPGAPSIKRIGESIYGIQHVSDIRINIGVEALETTYTFKTISPKFGKNTRDLEKKLTKISNDIKRLKLR